MSMPLTTLTDPDLRPAENEMPDDDDDEEEVAGAVTGPPEGGMVTAEGPPDPEDEDDEEEDEGPTLRRVAARACKRLYIGAAILPQPLFHPDVEDYDADEELLDAAASVQTHYARVLHAEFNAVVIEHHLKWAPLCVSEPGPLPNKQPCDRLGRYDFETVDRMVDWARSHDMTVKGHVLVWHVTSPTKLLERMEPEQVREELKRHIFTVMGHYRGRIAMWDVVNEALSPDGSLADTLFLRKLGPEYIELAFRWAHQADPEAILIYNDNKVEGVGSAKAEAFYQLLADLKAKGVPVHGCGMQAHWNAAGVGLNRPPTPRQIKEQIHRLGQLGLTVHFSELDVRVSRLPVHLRTMAQKQIYHDCIAAALSEPAFDGVWLWGFTDRHTWVSSYYYDDEPLIFDEDYRRKDAYFGLRQALLSLTPGHMVGGDAVLLDSDVDVHGQAWGHLWMQPEPPTDDVLSPGPPDLAAPASSRIRAKQFRDDSGSFRAPGSALPDWEMEEMQQQQQQQLASGVDDGTYDDPRRRRHMMSSSLLSSSLGDQVETPPDLVSSRDHPMA